MEQLLPFLIVCPLVALAGFVDAIAGGGGLISLPAYLMTACRLMRRLRPISFHLAWVPHWLLFGLP